MHVACMQADHPLMAARPDMDPAMLDDPSTGVTSAGVKECPCWSSFVGASGTGYV
jgi:hypothetical protein